MANWGENRAGWTRAAGALALAWLLLAQVLLSTVASFSRAPSQIAGLEAAFEMVICGHSADGSSEPSPVSTPGPHCLLCVLTKTLEAAGPTPTDFIEIARPQPATRAWTYAAVAKLGPEPEGGWASSWSSRAPPFNA